MTREEKEKIISNDYFDLFIKYNSNPENLKPFEQYSVQIINNIYAMIYIPTAEATSRLITEFSYSSIPNCYALTSEQSLRASGVSKLRSLPSFNLRGNGVLIGIIDTGIDYTNPVFMHKDGTSKIMRLWDQTIDSIDQYPNALYPTFYGTEYTSEQINQALQSNDPFQIVPSRDEIGHGTMMAGIAAGSENRENDFSGVAPDADLLVVKLKQAKDNLRDYFFIPPDIPCYQSSDILWGIQYLTNTAILLNRPLAYCIGLGTSQGPHDDSGILNSIVSFTGIFPEVAVSTSSGNEGSTKRHFFSTTKSNSDPIPVELNIGENESGFSMELWGNPPTIYTLDILSPEGDYIPKISELLKGNQIITFVFEKTIIYMDYSLIEEESGKQLILLRFKDPTAGIWKFNIYTAGDLNGSFHIWLPSDDFLSNRTYFLSPDPYTTLTSPGNCLSTITITAYNPISDTLYQNSGNGFSTSDIINPTLAAPGVDIQYPNLEQGFSFYTGTSAATAHAAGITALLLEWCIVKNNYPGINTIGIKKFLIRGARRSDLFIYPNRDWGYGIIDIFNTFNILKSEI